MLARWQQLSPAIRAEAEESLLARPAGVTAMLDAIEYGELRTADLTPSRIQVLRTHPSQPLRERAIKLFAASAGSGRQQVIDAYQPALTLPGDAARGRELFRKTCAACHRLEGTGHEIGPNLATLKNRGKEAILLNVLDPSREVNPQFLSYVVVTDDGLSHTGMIQSETATSVTLLRAENKTETILRAEIDQLRSSGLSLMPEGVEKDIDVQGMADLLGYLLEAR